MKKALSLFLSLIMVLSVLCCFGSTATAANPKILFSSKAITVSEGKAVTLKPVVSGTSKYTLVWSSSDKSVANVNSKGKISGVDEGKSTVTVKIKGTDASAKINVYVGNRITSVSVNKSQITLKAGESYKPVITLKPTDAAYKAVSYSSSNSKVASVSKGTIKAHKAGTAKITVKAADGSGKKTTITVKVTASGSKKEAEKEDKPAQTVTAKPASNEKTTGGFDKTKTSEQIVSEIKLGWNLGNSLDSNNHETAWGNPKTTKVMIDDIKKAGFNAVRIPVSWGFHSDKDGRVDVSWMNRVQEVVDYAYDNDMYVILNSHHDNAYYDIGGCVKNDDIYSASKKKMANVWKQIANTFKDYDERLIFETLNEPRTEGSKMEWMGGTADEREIVHGLNCAIVDSIRSTGGNNAYRHIMVPAYAATSSTSVLRQMKLPDDDRIIVSVHAYSPYNFAMNASASAELSQNDKNELDRFFKDLNNIFVSKGQPVIIGEFGATNKDNLDDRCEWAKYYVSGAGKYNIPCFWWDNNSKNGKGGECFGIYNRNTKEWVFPEIVDAMLDGLK